MINKKPLYEYLLTRLSKTGEVIETSVLTTGYNEQNIAFRFNPRSKWYNHNILYLGPKREPRRLVKKEIVNI